MSPSDETADDVLSILRTAAPEMTGGGLMS